MKDGSEVEYALVAPMVEQWTENSCVAGSSPAYGTKYNAWLAQLVERDVANVQVAGSNPVPRTKYSRYSSMDRIEVS